MIVTTKPPPANSPGKQKTVLLVDDQAFVRQIMWKALSATHAYKVLQAADGMAAINLMRDGGIKLEHAAGTDLMEAAAGAKIDCIVSDINMEPMNGLEFVKTIRVGMASVHRGTPVIMLTAHADKHFLSTAFALDVSGFLVKPVSGTVLVEKIERAIATPVALKSASDYATLIVPDVDTPDLYASVDAENEQSKTVRATDMAEQFSQQRPRFVAISELKVGDRLSEDLLTTEGVLVVPKGTRIAPALISALKDLSEIVKLMDRVSVVNV